VLTDDTAAVVNTVEHVETTHKSVMSRGCSEHVETTHESVMSRGCSEHVETTHESVMSRGCSEHVETTHESVMSRGCCEHVELVATREADRLVVSVTDGRLTVGVVDNDDTCCLSIRSL